MIIVRLLELNDYFRVSEIYKTIINEYSDYLEKIGKNYEESGSNIFDRERFSFYIEKRSSFVAIMENNIVGFIITQENTWIDWP